MLRAIFEVRLLIFDLTFTETFTACFSRPSSAYRRIPGQWLR